MDRVSANNDGYSTTRTATTNTMTTNTTWLWVIIAVAAIVIIGLVWYYVSQTNNDE